MKGQINQVFIYLVAILLIGAIALVGVRSIGSLLDDKCTVDMVRFTDKIDQSIRLNNDFGAVNKQELSSPCSFEQLCLIDARQLGQLGLTLPENLDDSQRTLILDSVNDGVSANVFLVDDKSVQPAGYIDELVLENQAEALCLPSRQGKFSFRTTGQGRTTLISSE